ncbi:MAG: rhodanese-like domain-containing protein [Nautiliaceae bacterium]
MQKIILLILSTFLFSYQTLPATLKNIKALQAKHIPIVDIRTPGEWAITGVIPGAIKDTFFDEYGRINPNFLKKIKAKKFAIICRTGHRSKLAAGILENKGIEVIDLSGGIFYLFKDMLSKEFK